MGRYLVYLVNLVITLAAAAGVFAYWLATRRRMAAETVGRAEEQAQGIVRNAEREADTRKKEALLEAKERVARTAGGGRAPGPRAGPADFQRRAGGHTARNGPDRAAVGRGPAREGAAGARRHAGGAGARDGGGVRALRAAGGLAAARTRTGVGPHLGGGPGAAAQADRVRRAPRRGQPGQAARGGGARAGVRARQAPGDRGDPAQRRRARHRDHGLGGRPAQRRSQGPHHRPRGPEHPGAGDGHRGRPDRR